MSKIKNSDITKWLDTEFEEITRPPTLRVRSDEAGTNDIRRLPTKGRRISVGKRLESIAFIYFMMF